MPPIRWSSATMTVAPCDAAMRPARTPPEPAPMTKKSTLSGVLMLETFAPLRGRDLTHASGDSARRRQNLSPRFSISCWTRFIM